MKKIQYNRVPIKVIDNFFESPQIWRYFALKQEFVFDESFNFSGQHTKLLSELNVSMFHSVARKLIKHLVGYTSFEHLEINFRIADASHDKGSIHHDDPKFNIVGLIYLNTSPPLNSGTTIYTILKPTENNYQEFASSSEDRYEQQQYFKKNMTIQNVFNRCVIYSPLEWHRDDDFFGSGKNDSRLTLNFFGKAI
jgi:hypothetical protein